MDWTHLENVGRYLGSGRDRVKTALVGTTNGGIGGGVVRDSFTKITSSSTLES